MKFYTGVDLTEISRIRKSMENPRFLMRFFSEEEQAHYHANGRQASYIASCFAAKEAFSKALGTGIRGFALSEVSALRDSLGKPYLKFCGNARNIVEQSGLQFDLSISHTRELATAFVVAWKE